MQNKQKQAARVTKGVVSEIEHFRNMRKGRNTSGNTKDDCYQNGELVVAAKILTDLAAKRASQFDTMEAGKAYVELRKGTYDYRHVSITEAGYPLLSATPPPEWPLAEHEWPHPHDGHKGLLRKAAALMVSEIERLDRLHNHMWKSGYSALNDEYRRLEEKRLDIYDKQRQAGYRRSQKEREQMAEAGTIAVDIVSTPTYTGQVQPRYVASNPIDIQECISEPYDWDSQADVCSSEGP